jgi:hypothetical protein
MYAPQRLVPARLQLGGHEPIVRVDRLEAALCLPRLVVFSKAISTARRFSASSKEACSEARTAASMPAGWTASRSNSVIARSMPRLPIDWHGAEPRSTRPPRQM